MPAILPINKYMWLIFYYDLILKAAYQHTAFGMPAAILVDSSWTDESLKVVKSALYTNEHDNAIAPQLVNKFTPSIEQKGSLPHLQKPAIGLYLEAVRYSSNLHTHCTCQTHFNDTANSTHRSDTGYRSLYTMLRAPWLSNRGSIPGIEELFLFSKASRPVLGPRQPPAHWIPRALPRG